MRNLASTAIGLLMVAHVTVQSREIDRERSTITIQVDKSGWLASFGDRHVIRAPIMHGTISESEQPAIEFEIESRQLKVVDPDLSNERRQEVQDRIARVGRPRFRTVSDNHLSFNGDRRGRPESLASHRRSDSARRHTHRGRDRLRVIRSIRGIRDRSAA